MDSPDAGDGEPARQERLLWIAEDDGVVGGDIHVRTSRGVLILSRRNNANAGWFYYDVSLKSGGRITSQGIGTSAIEFLTRNSSERSTWPAEEFRSRNDDAQYLDNLLKRPRFAINT